MKWLWGIVIVVLLAVGAYSVLWYLHAEQTKAHLIRMISDFSENKDEAYIAYEDMSISGYPFTYKVTLTNPEVFYNSDLLIRILSQGSPAASYENTGLTRWKNHSKQEGAFELEANYFTRELTWRISGNNHNTLEYEGNVLHWLSEMDGQTECTVGLTADAKLSTLSDDLFAHFNDLDFFIDNFKSLQCTADAMTMTDQDSGEVLHSSDFSSFGAELKDDDAFISASGSVHLEDHLTSDALHELIQQLISDEFPELNKVLPINSAEAQGEQDINIEFAYSGPKDFVATPNAELILDIPEFSIRNKLYEVSMPVLFKLKRTGEQVVGSLMIDSKNDYDESFDTYMDETIDQLVDMIYNNNVPDIGPELDAFKQQVSRNTLTRNLKELMPDFGAMGSSAIKADLSFKGLAREGFMANEGTFNINDAALLFGEKGLSLKGLIDVLPKKGNLAITCHQCDDTVRDLMIFVRDFQELIGIFDPSLKVYPISDRLIDDTNRFIEQISTKDGDNREITVQDDEQAGIMISGKSLQDVQMLLIQMFVPHMIEMQQQSNAQ